MVNLPQKRLQIFVSSTFLDLKEERQAAVEAILKAGHIPAGMKLFTAGDESQMTVIKKWIDESDIYLLILGGRYGSIEPKSGKSYTHIEYEYASDSNKPLFSCVINEDALTKRAETPGGSEMREQDHPQQLKEFRKLVCSKMVEFWSDKKDIKLAIKDSLLYFSRSDELVGWVKGSENVDISNMTDEIDRLSKENSDLREKLQSLESNNSELYSGLTYQGMKDILEGIDAFIATEKTTLLSFFLSCCEDLSTGIDLSVMSNDPINDSFRSLAKFGLVEVRTRPYQMDSIIRDFVPNEMSSLHLTQTGCSFLSKIQLEQQRN
jgi:Domain of unknown function (DUF4062)